MLYTGLMLITIILSRLNYLFIKLCALRRLTTILQITVCFAFINSRLFSQSAKLCVLKGQIITADHKPASYANVALLRAKIQTFADANGYFDLHAAAVKNDTLVITGTGITRYTLPVNIAAGETFNAGLIILQYNTYVLQDIEITGRVAESYKSDYSFSGTKTQTALQDIPQAISTVTKELIKDKMELRLKDAVEDAAGVNLYSGYDEYSIRGFRADNAHLINGLRAYNTTLTSPMLVNIERIEVIKGPSSVLYGNGDPGGTINMVTKKPLTSNEYSAGIYAGSWNNYRALADVTGPLTKSKKILYRFNAGYENEQSFRNQYFGRSFQLAPSVTYIPNEHLRVNADISISHTSTVVDRGQPGFFNDKTLTSTPVSLMVTQPGDYLKETDVTSIVSLSYKINSHITLNSAALNHLTYQKLSEHGIKSYITDDSVYLYYTNRNFNTNTTTLSNFATFNFSTGKLSHQLVAGYDFIHAGVTLQQFNGELPDDFGDGSGIVGTFSLKNPRYFKRPVASYEKEDDADEGEQPEAYTTQGAYLQEQLSFKKWKLLAALRTEMYSAEDDNDSTGDGDENVLLPRIGVVYKASNKLSLYATYNKGFDPFESSIIVQVFNAPFKPIYSEVLEAGAKASLFNDRLFATLSIYQLTLKNVAVNANDPANPDLYVQRGKEQAKGFETEINGNILPELSLTLSYSHNIAKVLESPVTSDIGKIKENAPRNASASWIKYTIPNGFAKGLGFSAGHSQEGVRNTLTEGLTLPAYCVINTGVSYIYKSLRIAFNLYNITNAVYWTGGYNYASKWPGAPRNCMINLEYAFGTR